MKILITGGTGFVGTHLTTRLIREGHEVTILTRSAKRSEKKVSGLSYLQGDPTMKGRWQEAICEHGAVVNLAGASIFRRWTEEYKKALQDSRLLTTRHLVEGIDARTDKKMVFVSASAVGYYGFHGDEQFTEESPPGEDFLARLACAWEQEASRAADRGARVVIARIGVVLAEQGGALGQMISLFKKYIGGPVGDGKQWCSWIHIDDLVEAFMFLIRNDAVKGAFNLCSPEPVRNEDLARAFGNVLRRPSFLPAPGFMIRLILGEFGMVILKGQRVNPRRLLDNGFTFQYPDITQALQNLVGQRLPHM